MVRKELKKFAALSMAIVMAGTTIAGCGGDSSDATEKETEKTTKETDGGKETADGETKGEENGDSSDKPFEGVKLVYAVSETATQGGEAQEIVDMVKEETGIEIEFTIVPNTNAGEVDKALVSLQGGEQIDILYGTTSKLKTFYNAGLLTPLDEIAEEQGYDMEKVFGDNLPVFGEETYGLPAFNDIWLTFYNKKIFDEAGVDYPTAENWTWDKYIETAKKLTDADNDIWGSFMLDYDNYNYMYATQKGAEPYKEDGTANFDDPLYEESVKWFYDLGNTEKIQPDCITYASGQYPWNSFVASGNMAMFVCGGWVASMLPDTEKYPRDWECGIVPMPYPEGEDPSTLAITGCYAVPTTSANKEAAFAAVKCIAENQYKLGYGRIPARVDLTEEEKLDYIRESLVPTYENDNISEEDFLSVWFDEKRTLLPEKIIGTADTVIGQIWTEEAQLYGQETQELEDAMTNIQERANNAIEEELAAQ